MVALETIKILWWYMINSMVLWLVKIKWAGYQYFKIIVYPKNDKHSSQFIWCMWFRTGLFYRVLQGYFAGNVADTWL